MLTFVGLGLYDLGDISVKGLDCVRDADAIYLESYTSRLMGTDVAAMEAFFGKEVRVLVREDVEQDPREVLERAARGRVVFLTGGDPMVSTTHADLRMRAAAAGIETSIIHASSISSAVSGLSGLQNYRFGKSCSVPFPAKGWFPTTPIETVAANLALSLHTLVYLDIQKDRYMCIPEAIALLEEMAEKLGIEPPASPGPDRRPRWFAPGQARTSKRPISGLRSMSFSCRRNSTPWSASTWRSLPAYDPRRLRNSLPGVPLQDPDCRSGGNSPPPGSGRGGRDGHSIPERRHNVSPGG